MGGVGEGRGAPGGTWPPPGRKFRPGAAVGWGPGWAVERSQKTAEFGNIQDECQPLTKDGLVCQAGNGEKLAQVTGGEGNGWAPD